MITRSKSRSGTGNQAEPVRSRQPLPVVEERASASPPRSDAAPGEKTLQERTNNTGPQRRGTGHHDEQSHSGLSPRPGPSAEPETRNKRLPWSKEELKDIMWCHYYCQKIGNYSYQHLYKEWRERNPCTRLNIDANKLQNQRRYILQNQQLSMEELEETECQVEAFIQSRRARPEELEDETHQNVDNQPDGVTQHYTRVRQRITQNLLENRPLEGRKRLQNIRVTRKVQEVLELGNTIADEILKEHENPDLHIINRTIYEVAAVITDELVPSKKTERGNNANRNQTPPWQFRLMNKIQGYRADLSNLLAVKKNELNRRNQNKLINRLKIAGDRCIDNVIEELKQKISLTAERLRRYKKRQKQYQENATFRENPGQFYRKLRQQTVQVLRAPEKQEVRKYWSNIYENNKEHNAQAKWINDIKNESIPEMNWTPITAKEVHDAISKVQSWKAPGMDNIPNFWIKQLRCTHEHLAKAYNSIIEANRVPQAFAKGKTYLIPKSNETEIPKNYRPITCLNTSYKVLTAIISKRISKHLETHRVMPDEQKGCKKGSRGCKDHIMLSRALYEDCAHHKKNLHLAWIDYQKAYDSVPHSWILQSLKLANVNNCIINFCRSLMETWESTIYLKTSDTIINAGTIKIRCGIYQGDSLSPLLFCVALWPLSKILNKTTEGYKIKNSTNAVNHLLYMDDLKLVAPSKAQLRKLLEATSMFSDDIKMKFGLDKCATAYINKGRLDRSENTTISDNTTIKALQPEQWYKYLGITEGQGFDDQGTKELIIREYKQRVRRILRSELNAKNKFLAIGTFAVPLIQYSFGLINWRIEEIQKLDRTTRKILTMHGALHPRADVERTYVPRRKGGRGLRQLEQAFKVELFSLAKYVSEKAPEDRLLQCFLAHDLEKPTNMSLTKKGRRIAEHIADTGRGRAIDYLQSFSLNQIKDRVHRNMEEKWKEKPMHGQLVRQMEERAINTDLSYSWLRRGKLKTETESLIVAAQDQAVRTRYMECKILKTSTDSRCRLCKIQDETITHIMAGCQVLARKEYIDRHNRVCTKIHFEISRHYGCPLSTENWYEHQPKDVTTSQDRKVTVLYDQAIHTDRTIPANRPDIVVKAGRETYLIEVSVPADGNIIEKEAEKLLKYKDLKIEIDRMWKTRTKIIPVVIGCTGYIAKSFTIHIKQIPGTIQAEDLIETAVLGTAHIIRRVLT